MTVSTALEPTSLVEPLHSSQLAPQTNWSDMQRSEHFVQFYEDDAYLLQSLTGFIAAGLLQNENVIVIATKPHRLTLESQLQAQGIDTAAAATAQHFIVLDAAETLEKCMVGGMPDERLFKNVVGGLVARVAKAGRPIRAFGEMVALLWRDGNPKAAIRLEELWNDLGKEYCFCLFCAYPLAGCSGSKNGIPFSHVCQAHTRVIPSESYTGQADADDRLRAITLLQQKAHSLEAEIQERKMVQKALAVRERELTDFLENATEAIHQVGVDGYILWANKAELNLLGYSKEEYVGRHISEFHADADVIAEILERLGRGEELHDCEARLRHKDGSLRYVSINSSVYWEGDKFIYTRCFTRDITHRKRAAEILEATVAERTEQLRATVAELEAFSYSISHDMRSPLRAMQGYAKTLVEDYGPKLDQNAVATLQRIQRASQRLDMLVRDVLSYSKIAKGDVKLQAIDLGEILEDVISQQPEFDGQRDRILLEHPLDTVLAHDACLIQCLTNLIANALKFVGPDVVPEVLIRSEKMGDKIRIWICDNGVGIQPEHRDRVFQIFGRIYPEKRYPGTGIGLAIVKKAVARMGGEVGFDSEFGNGCQFWFTLQNPVHAH